ncbi:hypothetical protein [Gimesia fumaroli]|uniref:Uncharacterized protein n=1 Tax=Gimesia fumaroli TaxID=2527976 RepID=A0A518II26_9PLAN|nr:hypothetical protein [Gimesia fumaroli]QDV52745.1 hypothetical protein Enr17x_48120 [Gimesia fumaroli]
MTEKQFTEKQILTGIFECWCDAMGTERPFDAETRIDLYMKEDHLRAPVDLLDIIFRLEKLFDIKISRKELYEELGFPETPNLKVWKNEIAPQLTFGVLARFLQKRAVNTVSFEPVMVINKECRPAGVFYGIEQISNQLISAKCQVTPSANIIDAFRGYQLNSFWSQLSWRSEVRLPQLSRHWGFLTNWGCMIAFWGLLIAFPMVFLTGNFYILLGAVLYVITTWFINSLYTHRSDPLPPELQTFRDLAVWIAGHDGDAIRIPANSSPINN